LYISEKLSMDQKSISFAGAGRVASALCKELFHAGFTIDLIVSESGKSAKLLADSCNAQWSAELAFPETTSAIIVAVPDIKLGKVAGSIKCSSETLVAHTAGSYSIDIFPEHILRKGVMYPLQTFSLNRKISFSGLPFLIESSDGDSFSFLREIVEAVSGKVYSFDQDQRRVLHLAAVFVNNFTNHLLTYGKEITGKADLPFELLSPLIRETIAKALETGPEISQTGPAVRNDRNTIEKHLELLSFSPGLQRIYTDLTESIIDYYKDKR
jgi:predicted short-subunit dehydrogenase-like oxidoreductase (DUF2520 family)